VDGLRASLEKMRAEGLSEVAVRTFEHYYRQLAEGETGLLAEDDIVPVESVPDSERLPDADPSDALERTIVIKLNGGLGTSMGMTRAKSLIEAREGLTFLDILARQVLALRDRFGVRLPLLLMNSFATRDDSLAELESYEDLRVAGLPLDFVQNKEPKLLAEDLAPVSWPADPSLEWCPPGHGDLYTAMVTSGTLEALLAAGFRWAFVSNSDNLGAVLDPHILAWFAAEQMPFLMEVADRTEADRKGGHLAERRREGGLVLREIAQTPEADLETFQDTSRHRYFNTNNLWVDLEALDRVLRERDGVLGLPMIVNRKTVDPSDRSSPEVIQIETAMGAAVDVFDDARAVRVPRRRFAPVKTTADLLVLRSDAYRLTSDGSVEPAVEPLPVVSLSDEFKLVGDFERRFPAGVPSLRDARRLTVEGDVEFGRGVVVRDEATVHGPRRVADGEVLGPQ
jgi:UTP--glucose-1-phosphate uridylyltransferase